MNNKKNKNDTAKFDLLRLENQLCFALSAAARALANSYRDRLEPLGLTHSQYLLMLVIWEDDGSSVSEIGQRLFLDSGTLSPLAKRLEKMELIERRRDKDDERIVRIWLTKKGIDLKAKALEAREYVACRLEMNEQEIKSLRNEVMGVMDRLKNTA